MPKSTANKIMKDKQKDFNEWEINGYCGDPDDAVKNLPLRETSFDEDIPWTLIESYFGENHLKQLVRHQLESYNDFITYQIEKTIHMFHPITICSEQDYDKVTQKYKLEMYISFSN